jgi:PAS domain-containing protein
MLAAEFLELKLVALQNENLSRAILSLRAVNQIEAMVAFWDANQICRFANDTHQRWFGKDSSQMLNMSLKEFLGPWYVVDLPHITGVLAGTTQIFEREAPTSDGVFRSLLVRFTPEIVDGVVLGFWVLTSDTTTLRDRERALKKALEDRDSAIAEIRTLEGLFPLCASCKAVLDREGKWHPVEEYLTKFAHALPTHGLCPKCIPRFFPGFLA